NPDQSPAGFRTAEGQGSPRTRRPGPARDAPPRVDPDAERRAGSGHSGHARIAVVGRRRRRRDGFRRYRRTGHAMPLQRLPAPDRAALRRARRPGIGRARRRALRELPEDAARTRTPGPPPGPARAAERKKPLEETFEDG